MHLYNNEKGITLIALIITVVVLLLLTSITISTIKNNGIINHAENQMGEIEEEIAKKNELLNKYADFLNSDVGGSTSGGNIVGNNTSGGSNNTTGGGNTITNTITGGNTVGGNTITGTTHTHSYTVRNTSSTYRKSSATCTSAAKYYYSCSCGAKGTSTFTSGNALGHNYSNGLCTRCNDCQGLEEYVSWEADTSDVWFYCSKCGISWTEDSTSWDKTIRHP